MRTPTRISDENDPYMNDQPSGEDDQPSCEDDQPSGEEMLHGNLLVGPTLKMLKDQF